MNLLYQERSFEIKMELVSHVNALLQKSCKRGNCKLRIRLEKSGIQRYAISSVLASKKTVVRFGLKKTVGWFGLEKDRCLLMLE